MPVTPITIAHAGVADLDGLVPLFDAYRVFYGCLSNPAECRYFLFNRLVNEDALILLAKDHKGYPRGSNNKVLSNETVVGFCQLYPTFSSLQLNQVWILNDLYVLPEARRQGIARRLIETARDFLHQRGDWGIVLETAPDNQPARTLYHSLGFCKDEAFDHYVLPFQQEAKVSAGGSKTSNIPQ